MTILAVLALALLGVKGALLDTSFRLSEQPHVTLALMGLTFGLWFAVEWLLFTIRCRRLPRRLRFTRELSDDRGPVETLWAKRTIHVHTVLQLASRLRVPLVRVSDLIPAGARHTSGAAQYEGVLSSGQQLELKYALQSDAIGRLRFEGLRLQMSDRHGLFYRTLFVRDGSEYRVLPPLADAAGHVPTVKRHNLLPPPGVHRLRRAGSGSELLDLRDYLPGDPPKTIAWKASARRDRLITKEFESEVPLRCTLFVDTSNSVRLGPPGQTSLTQLVEIASTVIQAATAERDLVGLCLFDDRATTYVRPARTSSHVVHLMNLLTDAAGLSPITAAAGIEVLQPLAYSYARQAYPELLRPDVNDAPAWLPWVFPPRADTMRKPTWQARLHGWSLPLGLAYFVACGTITWLAMGMFRQYIVTPSNLARSARPVYLAYLALLVLTLVMVGAILRVPAHFLPEQRRDFRRRKQLAAMLALRHRLPPGSLATLLEDEESYVLQLQRFLADHRVPYAPPLSESLGPTVFASRHKVQVLANALLHAVSRGHDNELFVLLVHLLETPEELDPLLRAARVAAARHHRVVVICPWPEEVKAVKSEQGAPAPADTLAATPGANAPGSPAPSPQERWQQAFQQVRRSFARLGILVVPARGGDPARLILERLDRLRMQGRTR